MTTIRPPIRPRTPIKCIGPYTGAGDPKVKAEQWDEIGKDMYDAGFNQFSVFLVLATPLKFWPIPMTKEWEDHIYTMLERLAFWRISPKIKFVDQFHEDNDDPFARLSVEQLYSSWDGDKYSWIKWDEPAPRKYTNFRATTPLGKDIIKYIQTVVKCAQRVKDLKRPNGTPLYPDFRLVVAWANETMAIFDEEGNHPVKTRGDRDEILYYVQGLLKDAGFVLNKNLLVEVDYLAFRPDIRHVDYQTMANVSQYLTKKGQRLEIHGILTVDDIKKYIAAGVNPKSSLFSTDGDLKMIDYEKRYTALGHSPYHVDLKLDCKKGQPFFPTNFMKFWRTYFPAYKTFIKG